MPDDIILRPATLADAPAASRLIYAASPLLFNRLYGPRPEEASDFFKAVFIRPGTPFSHENALVAEQGGEVIGLALSLPAVDLRRAWPLLGRLMVRLRGFAFLLRMPVIMFDLRGSSDATPLDAYYLSILSVRADKRSQGVGGLLLAEACRRAKAAGCAAICLHAEIDNDGARRFYERHGFRVTSEHPTPSAARWGVAGFASLRKEVES